VSELTICAMELDCGVKCAALVELTCSETKKNWRKLRRVSETVKWGNEKRERERWIVWREDEPESEAEEEEQAEKGREEWVCWEKWNGSTITARVRGFFFNFQNSPNPKQHYCRWLVTWTNYVWPCSSRYLANKTLTVSGQKKKKKT